MPIYEFYCSSCNMIFNFLSSRVDTTSSPDCPQCGEKNLRRQISKFATLRSGLHESDESMAGIDEATMERAFESLMQDAGKVNEDDPRQMASLMRKFTEKAGLNLGDAMEEAICRMEAGEDPDQVEKEMGDLLENDDISFNEMNKKVKSAKAEPKRDEKLYKL